MNKTEENLNEPKGARVNRNEQKITEIKHRRKLNKPKRTGMNSNLHVAETADKGDSGALKVYKI